MTHDEVESGSPHGSAAMGGGFERRPRFHRLGLRRQFLPLLIAITLLSSLGISALVFLATRADAIAEAQTRAAQDVQVERQLLTDQGAGVSLSDGHLVVGMDSAALTLNGDTTIVERTRALVGADATIYELEGPSLVAISTTLPKATGNGHILPGSRALGDNLTGDAYTALLGRCDPTEPPGCHGSYSGVVTLQGRRAVASFVPLQDLTGAFVGALGVAIPIDSVMAPSLQLSVMLLLVGLLVALAGTVAGYWVFGSISSRMFATLEAQLQKVAQAASQLEGYARTEIECANRQTRVATQVSEQARALDDVAAGLAQGHTALHESASSIWNEMSHPGLAPDPQVALHLARQAAVVSGQIGASVADVRDRCRQLVRLMNHILAESSVAGQSGGATERHARELCDAIEQVEVTLGQRLVRLRLGFVPPWRRLSAEAGDPASAQPMADARQRHPLPPRIPPRAPRTAQLGGASTGRHPAAPPRRPTGGPTGMPPSVRPATPGWGARRPSAPPGVSQSRGPRFTPAPDASGASGASGALPGLPPELPSWRTSGQRNSTPLDTPWPTDTPWPEDGDE